jgi:hypothetical protein
VNFSSSSHFTGYRPQPPTLGFNFNAKVGGWGNAASCRRPCQPGQTQRNSRERCPARCVVAPLSAMWGGGRAHSSRQGTRDLGQWGRLSRYYADYSGNHSEAPPGLPPFSSSSNDHSATAFRKEAMFYRSVAQPGGRQTATAAHAGTRRSLQRMHQSRAGQFCKPARAKPPTSPTDQRRRARCDGHSMVGVAGGTTGPGGGFVANPSAVAFENCQLTGTYEAWVEILSHHPTSRQLTISLTGDRRWRSSNVRRHGLVAPGLGALLRVQFVPDQQTAEGEIVEGAVVLSSMGGERGSIPLRATMAGPRPLASSEMGDADDQWPHPRVSFGVWEMEGLDSARHGTDSGDDWVTHDDQHDGMGSCSRVWDENGQIIVESEAEKQRAATRQSFGAEDGIPTTSGSRFSRSVETVLSSSLREATAWQSSLATTSAARQLAPKRTNTPFGDFRFHVHTPLRNRRSTGNITTTIDRRLSSAASFGELGYSAKIESAKIESAEARAHRHRKRTVNTRTCH